MTDDVDVGALVRNWLAGGVMVAVYVSVIFDLPAVVDLLVTAFATVIASMLEVLLSPLVVLPHPVGTILVGVTVGAGIMGIMGILAGLTALEPWPDVEVDEADGDETDDDDVDDDRDPIEEIRQQYAAGDLSDLEMEQQIEAALLEQAEVDRGDDHDGAEDVGELHRADGLTAYLYGIPEDMSATELLETVDPDGTVVSVDRVDHDGVNRIQILVDERPELDAEVESGGRDD